MAAPLIFHHGVSTVLVPDSAPPITQAKSSIIGLVGTAGMGPVNVPTLIVGNRKAAVDTFGEYHLDGFTIPESFEAMFEQGGVTVVVINVCDPTVHLTSITGEKITFSTSTQEARTAFPYHSAFAIEADAVVTRTFAGTPGTITIPSSATIASIHLTGNMSPIANVSQADYTTATASGVTTITRVGSGSIALNAIVDIYYSVSGGFLVNSDFTYDAQHGILTRVSTGSRIIPGSSILADYTYTDPTQVDNTDVIGTVTSQQSSGAQALLTAAAKVKLKPRILCAPHFTEVFSASDANAVVSAFNIISNSLSARFICDAPNLDRDSAVTQASFFGGPLDRVYMHYPYYEVESPDTDDIVEQPTAARIAGLIAVVDNTVGFWNSPSNREILGVLGLSKDLSFSYTDDETDTDLLNSQGVATTVFADTFRLYGNRQTNMDFLSVDRTADMIMESVATSQTWAVDQNITVDLVQQIVESVKSYLRTLESFGALIPNPNPSSNDPSFNDCWADPDFNTADQVGTGNLWIDYRFNPPFPAEDIHFQAHLTRNYLTSIFVAN